MHLKWAKTGESITGFLGVSYQWKCKNCDKKIYRDVFDPPVSYID